MSITTRIDFVSRGTYLPSEVTYETPHELQIRIIARLLELESEEDFAEELSYEVLDHHISSILEVSDTPLLIVWKEGMTTFRFGRKVAAILSSMHFIPVGEAS